MPSHQKLQVTSRQLEADLGVRLPKHLPSSTSAMTPTTAVIQVEATEIPSSGMRKEAIYTRNVPEWILTSRPLSRAHVHLISCFLLPVKEALRPYKSKIKDDTFFTPWPAAPSPKDSRDKQSFTRDERLSYADQLHYWHVAAHNIGGSTGSKLIARIHENILDPGPTVIRSVYVRILLQMALDAMGSYFVEHDLSLLGLDGITRQLSEQEHVTTSTMRGGARSDGEDLAKRNAFIRMLRRHSAT